MKTTLVVIPLAIGLAGAQPLPESEQASRHDAAPSNAYEAAQEFASIALPRSAKDNVVVEKLEERGILEQIDTSKLKDPKGNDPHQVTKGADNSWCRPM